jgi:hypothetical protein
LLPVVQKLFLTATGKVNLISSFNAPQQVTYL